jgi:cytochrome P450
VHIRDSDYYEELFVRSGKLDKPYTFCHRFGTDDTFFSTPSHDLHKIRRGAVAPFFSKRNIINYQPMIRAKLKTLIEKLAAYKGTG